MKNNGCILCKEGYPIIDLDGVGPICWKCYLTIKSNEEPEDELREV